MSTDGATKDYDNGPKNNWRRSSWNAILKRTNGRERIYPIIYLPGSEDLDREIATSKGVPPQNMIAVDRDQNNVAAIRSRGLPSLRGDVYKTLYAWPNNHPVAAAMLDFCGGLEPERAYDLMRALMHRQDFAGGAVMLNFQRGREQTIGTLPVFKMMPRLRDPLIVLRDTVAECQTLHLLDEKNRALMFYTTMVLGIMVSMSKVLSGSEIPQSNNTAHQWIRNIAYKFRPWFFSYHSGALVFDSIVLSIPTMYGESLGDEGQMRALVTDKIDYRLRQRIIAMLAVRTRRIQKH